MEFPGELPCDFYSRLQVDAATTRPTIRSSSSTAPRRASTSAASTTTCIRNRNAVDMKPSISRKEAGQFQPRRSVARPQFPRMHPFPQRSQCASGSRSGDQHRALHGDAVAARRTPAEMERQRAQGRIGITCDFWSCSASAAVLPLAAADLRLGFIGTDVSHVIHFSRILNQAGEPDHIAGARIVAAYKSSSPDIESSRSRVEGFARDLRRNTASNSCPTSRRCAPKSTVY